MRLLVRSLGGPVPTEVKVDQNTTLGALLESGELGDIAGDRPRLVSGARPLSRLSAAAAARRLPLPLARLSTTAACCLPQVYRGQVLRDPAARLRDLLVDGDTLVALPSRAVVRRPTPPGPPSKVCSGCTITRLWFREALRCLVGCPAWMPIGIDWIESREVGAQASVGQVSNALPSPLPTCLHATACRRSPPCFPQGPTLREINAAIRESLAAQGPATLAAAEAAAAEAANAAPAAAAQLPSAEALEAALLRGEMSALRGYLEHLQVGPASRCAAAPFLAGAERWGGGPTNDWAPNKKE